MLEILLLVLGEIDMYVRYGYYCGFYGIYEYHFSEVSLYMEWR